MSNIRQSVRIDQDLVLKAHFKDAAGNEVPANEVPASGAIPLWEADAEYFTLAVDEDGLKCVASPTGKLGYSAIVAKYSGLSTSYIINILPGNVAGLDVGAEVVESNRDENALAAAIARQNSDTTPADSSTPAADAPASAPAPQAQETPAAAPTTPAGTVEVLGNPQVSITNAGDGATIVATPSDGAFKVPDEVQPAAGATISEIPTNDGSSTAGGVQIEEIKTGQGLSGQVIEGTGTVEGAVVMAGGGIDVISGPASTESAPVTLLGADRSYAYVQVGTSEVAMTDIVKAAQAKSNLSAEAWNKLAAPERDALIDAEIDHLRATASASAAPVSGVPVSTQEANAGIATSTPPLEQGPASGELQGSDTDTTAAQADAGTAVDFDSANMAGSSDSESYASVNAEDVAATGEEGGVFQVKTEDGQEGTVNNATAADTLVAGGDTDAVATDEGPSGLDTVDGGTGKEADGGDDSAAAEGKQA
jgi:hypothetical protein